VGPGGRRRPLLQPPGDPPGLGLLFLMAVARPPVAQVDGRGHAGPPGRARGHRLIVVVACVAGGITGIEPLLAFASAPSRRRRRPGRWGAVRGAGHARGAGRRRTGVLAGWRGSRRRANGGMVVHIGWCFPGGRLARRHRLRAAGGRGADRGRTETFRTDRPLWHPDRQDPVPRQPAGLLRIDGGRSSRRPSAIRHRHPGVGTGRPSTRP